MDRHGVMFDRAVTPLVLFNDVVVRAALARGVDVLGLRGGLPCGLPADETIEPSDAGGPLEHLAVFVGRPTVPTPR